MKRTTKKRRPTLDILILITMEEKLLNTEHAKTSKIISVGMAIMEATLDIARRDEKRLSTTLKELEHLRHLEKYYQDSTQDTMFLRSEFQDAYAKFINEQHLFMTGIADFQEDTLMELATCRDVEMWYEKSHQKVERIDFISAVQKGQDVEEHDIQVLRDSSINHIMKVVEY
jgi:uncharacterized protein YaeQ